MFHTFVAKEIHTKVVKGVEDSEDIKTVLNSLFREIVDSVVTIKIVRA